MNSAVYLSIISCLVNISLTVQPSDVIHFLNYCLLIISCGDLLCDFSKNLQFKFRSDQGISTFTGTLLFEAVPSPNCPDEFRPQASTCPVLVSAREKHSPAEMEIILAPAGRDTFTGTVLKFLVSLPSCPDEFDPQASNSPALVRARE